jgi:hypothetical protein
MSRPWFDNPTNIWRGSHIIKLLIMHSSPASCPFLPLTSKSSPQHPVLKHSQSMVFLKARDQDSHP